MNLIIFFLFVLLAIILSVAVAGLYLEYARRSKNDADKETRQLDRVARMEEKLAELEINLTNQSAQMRELERLIHHNGPSSPKPSSLPEKVSSLLSANKKPTTQAFSILNTSTIQSPLIQLHAIDYYLSLPVIYAIEYMNNLLVVTSKQWSSFRKPKH